MRLGSSILGGKPMRIPGVVDVYQVGDKWVARSWPKVQNQPNSAAQLLWRKKFKDAHAMVKNWQGVYMDSWQAIDCPPGKMWIDIALHSILTMPRAWNVTPTQQDFKLELYRVDDLSTVQPDHLGQFWPLNYCLFGNAAFQSYATAGIAWHQRYGSDFTSTLKWNDLGWICPEGKRPKKKWGLSYASEEASDGWGNMHLVDGEMCVFWWLYYDERGVAWERLYNFPATADKESNYALEGPPLYRKPIPFPGVFHA